MPVHKEIRGVIILLVMLPTEVLLRKIWHCGHLANMATMGSALIFLRFRVGLLTEGAAESPYCYFVIQLCWVLATQFSNAVE